MYCCYCSTGRTGAPGAVGQPGNPGPSASFSPQAMMMMFRQPQSNGKGYVADQAYDEEVIMKVTKVVDGKYSYTVCIVLLLVLLLLF